MASAQQASCFSVCAGQDTAFEAPSFVATTAVYLYLVRLSIQRNGLNKGPTEQHFCKSCSFAAAVGQQTTAPSGHVRDS